MALLLRSYFVVISDDSKLTLLALFYASAAFDNVDHEILLKRLNISFGFSGTMVLWLRSFLSERSFCVICGPSRSPWAPAPYGIPQGSVLGPLVYITYTSDLASLLAFHAVLAHILFSLLRSVTSVLFWTRS